MARILFAIAALTTIACASNDECPPGHGGCGDTPNPRVAITHADGRRIASGEKLRIEIDDSSSDTKSVIDFDCTFGVGSVCATCVAANMTQATLSIECPSSLEIDRTTTITIEPFGGGAPLASATFTPHGTTVYDACCPSVTWDAMSITIP